MSKFIFSYLVDLSWLNDTRVWSLAPRATTLFVDPCNAMLVHCRDY